MSTCYKLVSILMFFLSTTVLAGDSMPPFENKNPKNPHIILIGASYLNGWTLSELDCLPVINKGVGGETSSQVRSRFEEDALSSNPEAVVIWGHINDFSNGAKEKELITRKMAIQNIKEMAELAEKHGVIPILATEITMGSPDDIVSKIMGFIGKMRGKRSYQQYISTNVIAVNDWIRQYADQHGYLILDIEKIMTNSEGNRKSGYYTDDLSHITELAYNELLAVTTPIMRRELIDKDKLCRSKN